MRTLAFVTQKGGVGKSTLAACLAVAASEAGETVCILDADPLGALTRWAQLRPVEDIGVLGVEADTLQATLEAVREQGATLAIIDTPGGDASLTEAAMRCADLSIIPARPNAFDLWATENTRKALKRLNKKFAFLLNQCPPVQQSARVEQGVQALEALGGLVGPLISARVDYQEAARSGLGVTEIRPRGIAAEEMRALWASINGHAGLRVNGKAYAANTQSNSANPLMWWMSA